jgi:hypothetical protein
MNKNMLGARVVGGILPFFKVMFFSNILVVVLAAIFGFHISLLHILIYPSIVGLFYAIFNIFEVESSSYRNYTSRSNTVSRANE